LTISRFLSANALSQDRSALLNAIPHGVRRVLSRPGILRHLPESLYSKADRRWPTERSFGGIENYVRAVQDTDFLNGLKNIFLFGIVQIPVMLGLAILLALLLDQSRGLFSRICRTVYFLPYTIPTAIGGLIWGYMYSRHLSPFNQVLSGLHLGTVDFLSPAILLFSIGNIVTWTWTGYNMITLFAALQNIPKDIFEAARVDGATTWNIVRYIKIPLIITQIKLWVPTRGFSSRPRLAEIINCAKSIEFVSAFGICVICKICGYFHLRNLWIAILDLE